MVTCPSTLPAGIDFLLAKQSTWDRSSVERDKYSNLVAMSNPVDLARLAAPCFLHSRDWLTTVLITFYGFCIDNKAVVVAVGLWLVLDFCNPDMCLCVDAIGRDAWSSQSRV